MITVIYAAEGTVWSDFQIREHLEDYDYAQFMTGVTEPFVVASENFIRLVMLYVAKVWIPWREVEFIIEGITYGVNRYGQFTTSYPPTGINLGYDISKEILQLVNTRE
jgi:hypothetical protein